MFGIISTKDLYIIEIARIIDVKFHSLSTYTTYYGSNKRYALARKKDFWFYDVFTNTEYQTTNYEIGSERIVGMQSLITDKKFITSAEGLKLLETLNPTYFSKDLSKKNEYVKVKKKN